MPKTNEKKALVLWIMVLVMVLTSIVYSHCQIPCGIYGDSERFKMIAEHIKTIEKSMKQITELSKEKDINMNQMVRWVNNKEKHARKISHIVTYYFMAQRLKPVEKANSDEYQKYINKLSLLHRLLVYSMKAKQSTDMTNVEKLEESLAEFQIAYYNSGAGKG